MHVLPCGMPAPAPAPPKKMPIQRQHQHLHQYADPAPSRARAKPNTDPWPHHREVRTPIACSYLGKSTIPALNTRNVHLYSPRKHANHMQQAPSSSKSRPSPSSMVSMAAWSRRPEVGPPWPTDVATSNTNVVQTSQNHKETSKKIEQQVTKICSWCASLCTCKPESSQRKKGSPESLCFSMRCRGCGGQQVVRIAVGQGSPRIQDAVSALQKIGREGRGVSSMLACNWRHREMEMSGKIPQKDSPKRKSPKVAASRTK